MCGRAEASNLQRKLTKIGLQLSTILDVGDHGMRFSPIAEQSVNECFRSDAQVTLARDGQRRACSLPQSDGLLAGCDPRPIGAEVDAEGVILMSLKGQHDLARRRVPQAERPVVRDRGDACSIGAERHSGNDIGMPAQCEPFCAGVLVVELFGDLNCDCAVDLADLAILLANYGTTSDANPEDSDLDADGDVDLSDLAALLANYGATCG
jgi:hypothetical protein